MGEVCDEVRKRGGNGREGGEIEKGRVEEEEVREGGGSGGGRKWRVWEEGKQAKSASRLAPQPRSADREAKWASRR